MTISTLQRKTITSSKDHSASIASHTPPLLYDRICATPTSLVFMRDGEPKEIYLLDNDRQLDHSFFKYHKFVMFHNFMFGTRFSLLSLEIAQKLFYLENNDLILDFLGDNRFVFPLDNLVVLKGNMDLKFLKIADSHITLPPGESADAYSISIQIRLNLNISPESITIPSEALLPILNLPNSFGRHKITIDSSAHEDPREFYIIISDQPYAGYVFGVIDATGSSQHLESVIYYGEHHLPVPQKILVEGPLSYSWI